MRLLGSMEPWLASTFLPLLLLTWLPVGLSSTAREVKWFNVTRNGGEQQNGGGMEKKNYLAQLIFANVNKTNAGSYTCRVENTRNMSKGRCSELSKGGTASQMVKPVSTVHLEIGLENLKVQVKWYNSECLEKENQTNTVILRENCMNFTSSSLCTAHTRICVSGVFFTTPNSTDAGNQTNTVFRGENCRNFTNSSLCTACTGICVWGVFITRPNSTDTGDSTQAAYLSCGCARPQTDVTGKIWTGLNLLLCILLGLAVGTLLYMPVIAFLLWQRRRDRTGELMSGEVTEGNQASTAAPVTGTEDLTYANLNFEKKGTGSASSNVIYTEIKPLQQKQSGGDGSAAYTEVDVSLKEEGK